MCMGMATANTILVVGFARERLADGDAAAAALEAGLARFRPVLMTALAMIIGMLPMAWRSAKAATERAARPRGDRRLIVATAGDADLRSRRLHFAAFPERTFRSGAACRSGGRA